MACHPRQQPVPTDCCFFYRGSVGIAGHFSPFLLQYQAIGDSSRTVVYTGGPATSMYSGRH
jgi:hypothetical protein